MKINFIILSTCLILMASACTVNKRTHRPGYNVEWHSANPKPQKHLFIELQAIDQLSVNSEYRASSSQEEELQISYEKDSSETIQFENAIAEADANIGVLERTCRIRQGTYR